MLNWFKCQKCILLESLLAEERRINKELLDRLMSFNRDAFSTYQAEIKPKTNLYPSAVNEKGEEIVYNDNPEKVESEAWKILGGEPATVDEFPEEAAARVQNERS